MILARGTHVNGQPILVLGLTRQECERMLAGKKIEVPLNALETVGLKGEQLMITAAETNEALNAELDSVAKGNH